jgi:hypothetical protein
MEAAARAEGSLDKLNIDGAAGRTRVGADAGTVGGTSAGAGGRHRFERDLANDLAVLNMVMNPEQAIMDDKELLSLGSDP